MKRLPLIGLLAGLLLLALLFAWQGLVPVIELLSDSGWKLLFLPLAWLPGLMASAVAWRYLFPPHRHPGWRPIMLATWMGHAVNNLLPVASIGGEIARARLLRSWHYDGTEATASVIVDKTIQAVALMLWGLIGVGLLTLIASDIPLSNSALAGFLLLGAGILAFIVVQKAGLLGFLAGLAERLFRHGFIGKIKENAAEVDARIRATYERRCRLALSILWHTFSLTLQTAEILLGCYLLGQPIGLMEAMLLKSLTSTISDIAFIVPNGYGIQEGAYIMIGTLVGLAPEFSLALALAIRIRDVAIDFPGLIHWQALESRQLLAGGRDH